MRFGFGHDRSCDPRGRRRRRSPALALLLALCAVLAVAVVCVSGALRNVALGKPLIDGRHVFVTDGNIYGSDYFAAPLWFVLDLEAEYDVHTVVLHHFWADARVYRDVIVQLAADTRTPPARPIGAHEGGRCHGAGGTRSGVPGGEWWDACGLTWTTVFNSDHDNTLLQGGGRHNEYHESERGLRLAMHRRHHPEPWVFDNGKDNSDLIDGGGGAGTTSASSIVGGGGDDGFDDDHIDYDPEWDAHGRADARTPPPPPPARDGVAPASPTVRARYIRVWGTGNDHDATGNHIVELAVYGEPAGAAAAAAGFTARPKRGDGLGTNVALNKPIYAVDSAVNDGDLASLMTASVRPIAAAASASAGASSASPAMAAVVELDLERVWGVAKLQWFRFPYGAVYDNTVVELSVDRVAWTSVYNTDSGNVLDRGAGKDVATKEHSDGRTVVFAEPDVDATAKASRPRLARYVRFWSGEARDAQEPTPSAGSPSKRKRSGDGFGFGDELNPPPRVTLTDKQPGPRPGVVIFNEIEVYADVPIHNAAFGAAIALAERPTDGDLRSDRFLNVPPGEPFVDLDLGRAVTGVSRVRLVFYYNAPPRVYKDVIIQLGAHNPLSAVKQADTPNGGFTPDGGATAPPSAVRFDASAAAAAATGEPFPPSREAGGDSAERLMWRTVYASAQAATPLGASTEAGLVVDIPFATEPFAARYVRLYCSGSDQNDWKQIVEVEVFANGNNAVNVASGARLLLPARLNVLTDEQYHNGAQRVLLSAHQPLTIDLRQPERIQYIRVLHSMQSGDADTRESWGTGGGDAPIREYSTDDGWLIGYGVVVQVSRTGAYGARHWRTLFNGDVHNSTGFGVGRDALYVETEPGKSIDVATATAPHALADTDTNANADDAAGADLGMYRFVRIWRSGSSEEERTAYAQYTEVEVWCAQHRFLLPDPWPVQRSGESSASLTVRVSGAPRRGVTLWPSSIGVSFEPVSFWFYPNTTHVTFTMHVTLWAPTGNRTVWWDVEGDDADAFEHPNFSKFWVDRTQATYAAPDGVGDDAVNGPAAFAEWRAFNRPKNVTFDFDSPPDDTDR